MAISHQLWARETEVLAIEVITNISVGACVETIAEAEVIAEICARETLACTVETHIETPTEWGTVSKVNQLPLIVMLMGSDQTRWEVHSSAAAAIKIFSPDMEGKAEI